MRRMLPVLCAMLVLAALLAGCRPHLTQANVDKVTDGMTPAQCRAILGPPTETGTREVPLLGKLDRLTYREGQSEVNLLFYNDRLQIKSVDLK
ncbi:MAG TPA: hypothetical protein VGE98_14580 [Thermoanaerobaculia bacterium]